jgi:hypothetical protein
VEEYLVFALVLQELRARLVFDCLISVSVMCLLVLVARGSFLGPLPLFALVLLVFAYLCVTLVLAVIRLVSDERIICISRTYLVRAFFFTPQFALWSTPFDNTHAPSTWILCTRNVNHAGTCKKCKRIPFRTITPSLKAEQIQLYRENKMPTCPTCCLSFNHPAHTHVELRCGVWPAN